jgi:hypothetical protein
MRASSTCTVVQPPQGEGAALAAREGLSIDTADPIAPGETRTIRITAEDSLWQRERLDGLIRDADTRMGGLLFLYDNAGQRYVSSVSAPVILKFTDTTARRAAARARNNSSQPKSAMSITAQTIARTSRGAVQSACI